MTTIEITPKQIPSVCKDCHESNVYPFFQGQPGVGKSEGIMAYAKTLSAEYIDVRLAYFAPQDVQGYPYLADEGDSKTMRFSKPAFWPKTETPVISLEEFNCANRSVQNTALQLLNERRIGENILPDKAFVALCGNRHEDKVNIEKLSSAVVDRIVNIRVRLDLESWIEWAQKNAIDPLIIAFMRFSPHLLSNFDGAKWDGVSSFATPRGWAKVSRVINNSSSRHIRHAIVNGIVGEAAGATALGFIDLHDQLPDLNKVLAEPDKADVPSKPDVLWATLAGLSRLVKPKTFENLVKYAERMSKDFEAFAIKTAVFHNKALMNTTAFSSWVTRNPALFATK